MPDYVEVLRSALVEVGASILSFLPQLVFAVLVFLLGLLLASILQTAIVRLIRFIRVDELMDRLDVKTMFDRAGIKLDVAELFGWLVKWLIIFVALIAAADVLEWTQVTEFFTLVVEYIPNVLVAIIILLVGFLLGNFVNDMIKGAVKVAKMTSVIFLAAIAKWSIIVFSFMVALTQLGIGAALIQTLLTGFVAMLAIAGGLAFGLGGKDHASKVLDHIYHDLTSKR